MRQQQKAEKISKLKTRLELYYKREEEMLSGGVQSYGIGTRNATRYQTALSYPQCNQGNGGRDRVARKQITAQGRRSRPSRLVRRRKPCSK